MDVGIWNYQAMPVTPDRSPFGRLWSPRVLGLVGTLLLHMLVVQSVILGSRAIKAHPPEVRERGDSLNKSSEPAGTLVLVDLPAGVKTPQEILEELVSAGMSLQKMPVTIEPDPLPLLNLDTSIDEHESAATINSGDGADHARLFGMYSGQIQARIDRAWRRPRTPVNEASDLSHRDDETFRCQVRVIQDSSGNVQEILLPNCNGSPAWQRSLVIAIQQSSPLPAPPSPTVFSHAMTLNFVGYGYVAGRSDEEYETGSVRATQDKVHPVQRISESESASPIQKTSTVGSISIPRP